LRAEKATRLAKAEEEKREAANKPANAPSNVRLAELPREAPTPAPTPGQGGIGHRQWGGDVRGGQSYMVGESGPETFTPAGPGQITPGGMDIGSMIAQYRQFADEIAKPLRANIEMPRSGPMRQRMSRRIEQQRERDVGRLTRQAAHSDIGFG
jgi:hypothetical protein